MMCWVTIRVSIIYRYDDGNPVSETIYFSIPMSLRHPKRKPSVKNIKNDAKLQAFLISSARDLLVNGGFSTIYRKNGHPFRSIDEMRMHHARAKRYCVARLGSTAPGEFHHEIWVKE